MTNDMQLEALSQCPHFGPRPTGFISLPSLPMNEYSYGDLRDKTLMHAIDGRNRKSARVSWKSKSDSPLLFLFSVEASVRETSPFELEALLHIKSLYSGLSTFLFQDLCESEDSQTL